MEDKDFIEWSDKYSVGIIKVDDQHKSIVRMINELYAGCREGKEKANEIFRKTIKGLVEYIQLHFKAEEGLLIKYKYPENGFRAHKIEHEKFVVKVSEMLNDFKENRIIVLDDIIIFLKDWLLNHIATIDKVYFEFLKEMM
jgi:hemerythrin-like metal-binding protein